MKSVEVPLIDKVTDDCRALYAVVNHNYQRRVKFCFKAKFKLWVCVSLAIRCYQRKGEH